MKIQVKTKSKKMLADVFTPVSIYLRIRDKFPGSILLESTDSNASDNSWSFIGIKPIAGIEVTSTDIFEFKYPGQPVEHKQLSSKAAVLKEMDAFLKSFVFTERSPVPFGEGLYGYSTY